MSSDGLGPLRGTCILVTRPKSQAEPLVARLEALGAEVLIQAAIRIGDPPDWQAVDDALARLERYDWLVFSSGNGVRYLLDRMRTIGVEASRVGAMKLAAIGPGTAEELARYGLRADLVPGEHCAEALAGALAAEAPGRRFLLARASRGREVLAEVLAGAGAVVDQVVVYSSTDVKRGDADADARIASAMAAGQIDWVTVTSSAIASSLASLFGADLRKSKLASISPVTSATLRGLGFEPRVEAKEYTMEGLVEAIVSGGRGARGEGKGKREEGRGGCMV